MKRILFCIILSGFTLVGCKDWLDINYSPNNATVDNVPFQLFLPQTMTRTAARQINNSDMFFLSHHLTKSGSVGGAFNFLTGLIQAQDGNGWWQDYYQINSNLKLILEKAIEREIKSFEGIAMTLMAYNFHKLVDLYGNIPYTEALMGAVLYQPAYDKAEDVYANLLTEIDKAIATLNAAKSTEQIAKSNAVQLNTNDIMAKGDIDKWIRFAHSIKLRMLMRLSGVQNVNSQVAAIMNNCLRYDEVMFCNPGYQKESGKMNPFYSTFGYNQTDSELQAHQFYRPTRDFVDMLRDNKDPRLRVYIQPRQVIGADPQKMADYAKWGLLDEYYIGIPYGQQNPPENAYTTAICIGILGLSSSMTTGPVSNAPVLAGFETQFFLAEAALKGIIPGGDAAAKTYYETGVKGVFRYLDVPLRATFTFPGYPATYPGTKPPITGTWEQAANEYLAQNNPFCNWSLMTTTAQKMEAIATQKWISLFGVDAIESWNEFRRLDLPLLGAALMGQEPKNISTLHYPQTETNLNEVNVNAAGAQDRTNNVYNYRMFWDKENPIVGRVSNYL